ncbi:MAG TPA: ribosome assembly factor SBDS [Candidatus Nanoarchaeia archaeon]|nr:ribosome assembly factor SBDS [Candidatus Nanoarchaeia archaeon]
MPPKITLARLKKFGITFEISVDPDKALLYKKGQLTDLDEVLHADNIFLDAKKGMVASDAELEKAFKTADIRKVADIIIKEGEIQFTAEHRAQEREQKIKKIVYLVHKQAIDARTGFPIPLERIEAALEQAKIHLDENKPIEDQLDNIITALRPILPIKIEQKRMSINIPSQYAGKAQSVLRSMGIQKEDWKSDGSWEVMVEVPAGLLQESIDKINAVTHGQAVVKML